MNKNIILLLSVLIISIPAQSKRWAGVVAKEYDNSEAWVELVTHLREAKMNYGALAASERILDYFEEMKSKEIAYHNIVGLIDFGFPFTLRQVFMAGDLELNAKDNFSQSYNLYKGTIDLEKNMPKWADNYFSRVDKETFPKYQFYQGIKEFNEGKLDAALVNLDKALQGLNDTNQLSLSKKVARTMARIYYEQTKYKESFDIYQNYLLKMNPIDSGDWVEGAWALYRLGRFDEALGYLYNLEVRDPNQSIYLEKYIIRALIYREKCATGYTRNLAKGFEKEYASTIEKIKMGNSLKTLPVLRKIVDRNSEYNRVIRTTEELLEERKRIKDLPSNQQKMAEFLYSTELKNQTRSRISYEDVSLNEAARRMVIMGESLRFLQFDVIREKYNPDKVFAPLEMPNKDLIENTTDNRFLSHWLQWGDFWRDERTLYQGLMKNWCE